MADIVERLKFDAVRCELQFSKGVAGNITEAAAEIERLRAALKELDAQSIASTDPNYVAVPAKLLADAVAHEQKADGNDAA